MASLHCATQLARPSSTSERSLLFVDPTFDRAPTCTVAGERPSGDRQSRAGKLKKRLTRPLGTTRRMSQP